MSNFNNLCTAKLQSTKRFPELCITQVLCFLPLTPTNSGEKLNEHDESQLSVKEQERSLIQLFVCRKTAWGDRFWLWLQNRITPGIKEMQLQVSPTNLLLHPELETMFHNKSHFLASLYFFYTSAFPSSRAKIIAFLFKLLQQILLKLHVWASPSIIRTGLQTQTKCGNILLQSDVYNNLLIFYLFFECHSNT